VTCRVCRLLPQAAVAMNVLVTSVGQLPPSVRLELTVTVPQLSVAVAIRLASGGTSARHSTVLSAGTNVKLGGGVACTVITWGHVALLLWASVTVYVRVRVNLFVHVWPLITSLLVTVKEPGQLSA